MSGGERGLHPTQPGTHHHFGPTVALPLIVQLVPRHFVGIRRGVTEANLMECAVRLRWCGEQMPHRRGI